jgi:DNA-binding transcriptional ArsR family regulator
MLAGLREFCRDYPGKIWLEILLTNRPAPGPADIRKLKAIIAGLRVDKIQLNTVDRPPAERFALPLPRREMLKIKRALGKKTEVISSCCYPRKPTEAPREGGPSKKSDTIHPGAILRLLARRPGTLADIRAGLAITAAEARRHLASLVHRKLIIAVRQGRRRFYRLSDD